MGSHTTTIIAEDGLTWHHSSVVEPMDEDGEVTNDLGSCARCGATIGGGIPYWAEVDEYGVEICEACPLVEHDEWNALTA